MIVSLILQIAGDVINSMSNFRSLLMSYADCRRALNS